MSHPDNYRGQPVMKILWLTCLLAFAKLQRSMVCRQVTYGKILKLKYTHEKESLTVCGYCLIDTCNN
jgi:hypothetical protein